MKIILYRIGNLVILDYTAPGPSIGRSIVSTVNVGSSVYRCAYSYSYRAAVGGKSVQIGAFDSVCVHTCKSVEEAREYVVGISMSVQRMLEEQGLSGAVPANKVTKKTKKAVAGGKKK